MPSSTTVLHRKFPTPIKFGDGRRHSEIWAQCKREPHPSILPIASLLRPAGTRLSYPVCPTTGLAHDPLERRHHRGDAPRRGVVDRHPWPPVPGRLPSCPPSLPAPACNERPRHAHQQPSQPNRPHLGRFLVGRHLQPARGHGANHLPALPPPPPAAGAGWNFSALRRWRSSPGVRAGSGGGVGCLSGRDSPSDSVFHASRGRPGSGTQGQAPEHRLSVTPSLPFTSSCTGHTDHLQCG